MINIAQQVQCTRAFSIDIIGMYINLVLIMLIIH